MSLHHVSLERAEEQYGPPERLIELSVHDDPSYGTIVLLSEVEYEEDADSSSTKRVYNFPAIKVEDLLRALSAFGLQLMSAYPSVPPYGRREERESSEASNQDTSSP